MPKIRLFDYFRKKLKRNIMILGVSGWLGGKLGIDETIIRIAFVISVLFFGVGIGIYLILWIVKLLSK